MHTNVYGPKASGKTRYAEELRKHFNCDTIVDEGKEPVGRIDIPKKGRALILTLSPIHAGGTVRLQHIPITLALREIGRSNA